jgi:hypothetical protein
MWSSPYNLSRRHTRVEYSFFNVEARWGWVPDVGCIEYIGCAFIKGGKKRQTICRCIITAHNSKTYVATCYSQQQLCRTFPHTHTHIEYILIPSARHVLATGKRNSVANAHMSEALKCPVHTQHILPIFHSLTTTRTHYTSLIFKSNYNM